MTYILRRTRILFVAAVAASSCTGMLLLHENDASASMEAVTPRSTSDLTVPTSEIADVEKQVREHPQLYGGITYARDMRSAEVHVAGPSNRLVEARRQLSNISSSQRVAPGGLKLSFVSARYSTLTLEQTMTSVGSDKVLGALLTEWGIDAADNNVHVGLQSADLSAVQHAQAVYGSKVRITEVPRASLASGRTRDSKNFFGGDRLARGSTGCTNSWTVKTHAGTKYSLTAGHCFPVGSKIYNSGNRAFMGTVMYRSYRDGGAEGELIGKNLYAPYIWTGGVVTTRARATTGSNTVRALYERLCLDGSYLGENCDGAVTEQDVCAKFKDGSEVVRLCHLDRIDSTTSDGTPLVMKGDSGGPVYRNDGHGGLTAYGVITGGILTAQSNYQKGRTAYSTRIGSILSQFKASLVLG